MAGSISALLFYNQEDGPQGRSYNG